MKTNKKPVVLIMAGGKGERFWPKSRSSHPKQLQKVYSNKSLLDETIDRALTLTSLDRIFIGCNQELKTATLKTHKRLKPGQFIVEPLAKNTAPIIAYAAVVLEKKYPDSIHIVLSADHFITTKLDFKKTLLTAIQIAQTGRLVTLGVLPNRPETGYGYIEKGKAIAGSSNQAFHIASFREKPDAKTATGYLTKKGSYYWNSGIFIWKGSTIIAEFERHAKKILELVYAGQKSAKSLHESFTKMPALPVDTAIMEKSDQLAVVLADFIWDDVGTWAALERIRESDGNSNVFMSESKNASLESLESKNNIVVSSKKLVAMLGVNDLVLVEDGEVLFVASKEKLDSIKNFMKDMKANPALQKFFN